MKPQHTKGQWITRKYSDGSICIRKEEKGIVITEVTTGLFPQEEAEANAKLIAAAPILYDAAYSALQAIYAMPKKKQAFYQYPIDDLLNAIQKANGTII